MNNKGNVFEGAFSGSHYRRWARCLGFNEAFYQKALGNLSIPDPINALDIGCGPGTLTYFLAQKAPTGSVITGLDLSLDQINYAKGEYQQAPYQMEFIQGSMDELNWPDSHFDLVVTSMALHETPPAVRRQTIKEVSRVLKAKGQFLLVDWSKPRLGLWGIIWFPLVFFGKNKEDNWHNQYKTLCEQAGLIRIEDEYINSISRRQLFEKQPCL